MPFSLEMAKAEEYYFIATEPFNKERSKIGYNDLNFKYPWIVQSYLSDEKKILAEKLINEADVVIYGGFGESLIKNRLNQGKLILRYYERLYRKGTCILKFPLRTIKFRKKYRAYKNQYLLCAGAYVAYDFARSRAFLNRTYKWGYFPEIKEYESVDNLIENKDKNSILWVGRLIDLKHPEFAVKLAKRLKEDGYSHKIKIIGTGEMEEYLKSTAKSQNLDNILFLGGLSIEQTREEMEKSEIFLFTSNKEEGWGAVLNESMNSGCAVVSSHACGAVPFMVKDEENGLIFESENFEDFYNKVKSLIDNPSKRKEISKNAYFTIENEWNGKVATQKLLELIKEIVKGNEFPNVYSNGVCSKAEIIKDNWYKKKKL